MNSIERQAVSGNEALIKTILCQEPGLKLAILYGSAAAGKMRADSDIDIALLFDRPLSDNKKIELLTRLEQELGRDIDLVDLFFLNGTILKQILSKGQVLIQVKPGVLAGLVQRMIYNQADMMPYVTRTLIERQQRFVHG
ncbi:MAG: nucleotidyltransferase domain-containing protein [Lentisphaerae bacterium]|jgi:predicted nucleotidyltransferase|nr:nucleotidyltransferase domain-containing protein [Lentisphaerota bacterium]